MIADQLSTSSRSSASALVGIATGCVLMTLMGIGFVLGGFLPPPGPSTAAPIATFYRDNVDLIRAAIISLIAGGTMFIPFGAAISDRIRTVPGIGPVAASTQMGAAIATATLMMVFGSILLVAVLRPDMPDSSYQLLNHVTWMAWAGLWEPGALQAVATATAIFADKSTAPVFPRWVAWYSLFMAFGSLMGSLIPFFTSGPFAWNGFISFWVAAAVFFAWFVIILIQFIKIYRRARASDAVEQVELVAPTDVPLVAEAST